MKETNTLDINLPSIHVESEWADLKECVYGSPDHWVLPLIYNDAKLRAQGEFGEFITTFLETLFIIVATLRIKYR